MHGSMIEVRERIQKTIAALTKNGIEAEYIPSRGALIERLGQLIEKDSLVVSGSSVTLRDTGVRDWLLDGPYEYYDSGDGSEDREEKIRKAFSADVYLTSVAAVTETGELLVVDGTGNRVAALSYGPKRVIIIAGMNKIVPDFATAMERLRTVAAPMNAVRRGKINLPCHVTGVCRDCHSPNRMCCYFLRIAFTRAKGRFRVLLLDEPAGY